MNKKLDKLFSFRDKEEYQPYFKGAISATLIYFLVVIGFICAGKTIDIMVFMPIPLLLICSFLRKNDYLFLVAELLTVSADICLMLFHYEPVLNYIEDLNKESKDVVDYLFSKRGTTNDN